MGEITRKLASVRAIADVEPIEGADRIVLATVDGWSLITQKDNNFKPGDFVVYFEIDSFLPVTEQFEWLRKSSFKSTKNLGDGFRIKTMKMRGQVSSGLIVPMDDFFEYDPRDGNYYWRDGSPDYVVEGTDLTEYLNVQKYEKPIPSQLQGRVKGNFPSFIPKTDQERIQNHLKAVTRHNERVGSLYEATMKLDGSSMTVYVNGEASGVCSRNFDLEETAENAFWQCTRQYDILSKLKSLGRNLALQVELMGPGVQGNREGFEILRCFVFDIFDIDNHKYLDSSERRDIVWSLGLEEAPFLGMVDVLDWTIPDFLAHAERKSINHAYAEGVVYKNLTDPNFSFKCISNNFLLKED